MFGFSGINKNYFLGIDFGTSAIKMVELEYKNGSAYLLNYGLIEIPLKKKASSFETKDESSEVEEKILLLKKLIAKMGIKSKSAYLSMGSFKGLSALITVNDLAGGDLEEAVRSEASKYIPVSLDEVYLSSDVVSRKSKDSKDEGKINPINGILKSDKNETLEVLLVAAPKEDVHKYERIVEESGLKVASFELDIFSAARAIVGDDLGKFLIVDIGAKITNIILVEKGIIRINRNINVGGDEITKNIASNLNVSWERAEEFKKKNNYLKEEGRSIVLPILSLIAKESKRVADLTSSGNDASKPLDGVVLVGGGAAMSGIEEVFSENFGKIVSLGNPLSRIVIENDRIKEALGAKSQVFTVALGLAMKGVDGEKK